MGSESAKRSTEVSLKRKIANKKKKSSQMKDLREKLEVKIADARIQPRSCHAHENERERREMKRRKERKRRTKKRERKRNYP